MKINQIIILVAGAVLLVALGVNLSSSASTYTGFQEAQNTSRKVHIVGQWVQRDQAHYDQERDLFRFYLKDENQQEMMVHFYDPKPVNFEQAEKVVIIGSYSPEKAIFEADEIQMKCPSKYEETDVTAAEKG
jgi:cytochrome c-type biogenesis protein CcmE